MPSLSGNDAYRPANPQQSPYVPYRKLLSPDRVRQLSILRPARPIADAVTCWAWILASFCLVAAHPAYWTVLAAIPVIGNRYYALFIIGHDGMHRRLCTSMRRNDFWADFLVFAPIGAVTRLNNRNHLAHHLYLSTPSDPDRHKHACFNKASHLRLLGFLTGLTSVWTSARAVFRRQESAADSPGKPKSSQDHYRARDAVLLGGWFVALAGGLTWLIGWWAYPLLWLLPVYLFMYLADSFRAFAEHSHPERDDDADRHRLMTFISSPIERILVAPMNMNFHTVHHLWPSIPYYNLPAADREIRQQGESMGLEWRRSYLGYLRRYWSALPLRECEEPQ